VAWTLLRALFGASLIGIYIAVESWLNERADATNRGRILGAYEMVGLGALAAGQFLLTVGELRSTLPFIIAAVLLAAGLVPVALTRLPEPTIDEGARLTLGALVKLSPVAVVGTVASSAAGGAFFSLGPLYAQDLGLTTAGIASYMSAALIGGALLQWPIGAISDYVDRRIVIGGASVAAAAASLVFVVVPAMSLPLLLGVSFFFGGALLTLYALCVAHANDLLRQAQFLDAARGFNFLYGVGAAAAPAAVGALMSSLGPAALYWSIAVLMAALGAFALLRALTTRSPAVDGREEFVPVTTPSAEVLELHPHDRLPEP
jgi:MFS family permease